MDGHFLIYPSKMIFVLLHIYILPLLLYTVVVYCAHSLMPWFYLFFVNLLNILELFSLSHHTHTHTCTLTQSHYHFLKQLCTYPFMGTMERTKYSPCFWQVILDGTKKAFNCWLNQSKNTSISDPKILCMRNMLDKKDFKKYLKCLEIRWFPSDW